MDPSQGWVPASSGNPERGGCINAEKLTPLDFMVSLVMEFGSLSKARFQVFTEIAEKMTSWIRISQERKCIPHHHWAGNSLQRHVSYRDIIFKWWVYNNNFSDDHSGPRPILADVAAYIDLFLAHSAPVRWQLILGGCAFVMRVGGYRFFLFGFFSNIVKFRRLKGWISITPLSLKPLVDPRCLWSLAVYLDGRSQGEGRGLLINTANGARLPEMATKRVAIRKGALANTNCFFFVVGNIGV